MKNQLIIDPRKLSEDLRIRLADELNDEHNLNLLSQDASMLVRLHVVWNPATPVKCLNDLAQDSEIGVRHAISNNSRTPSQSLKRLLQDSSRLVSSSAKSTLRKLGVKV